jgi:hypothetical protein
VGDYQEGKVQQLAKSGYFYTKKSCFLDLIREANRIGYTIYGYESKSYTEGFSVRDSMAAVNIGKIFEKNPYTKVLIHAGYGHTRTNYGSKNLYYYFRERTGIIPLAIDQTFYYGHPHEVYNLSYHTAFCKHFNPTEPAVLTDSSGHHTHFAYGAIDTTGVHVIAPYTGSSYGRPAWLFTLGARKAVEVKNIRKPSIIKAYCATESNINTISQPFYYNRAIPIDMLTIENVDKGTSYYLALPEGVFLIRYEDLRGKGYEEYYWQVGR